LSTDDLRDLLAGRFMTVKQMARLGGRARAAKLSAERRREIAVKAGRASGAARELACKLKSCQDGREGENKKK
jgi:hypothetical protein